MFKLVYLLLIGLVFEYSEANSLVNREFIGLCSTGSCKNGASCIQVGYNLAICLCKTGFAGIYCETPITTTRSTTVTVSPLVLCTPGICQRNGVCVQINENLAICVCQEGTSGLYCENGSRIVTLTSTQASITSVLAPTSTAVSTPPQGTFELCPSNPVICQNGGTCIAANRFITCFCASAYTGTFCDTKI